VQSPRENIPITPKSFRFTPRSVARPPEFVLIAFFSLLTALTFRGGLMRAMGLELVTGNGRPGVAPSGPCSDGNCLVTDHRDRTVADAASWHMDCAAVTALARARASRGCARCLAIGRMCNSWFRNSTPSRSGPSSAAVMACPKRSSSMLIAASPWR